VLRCQSSLGISAAVGWYHAVAHGTIIEPIVAGCDFLPALKPTLSSVYSLISDDPGQCDLVVNRTNTSLTGRYGCSDATQTSWAYLTIIGQLLLGCFTGVITRKYE